MRRVQIVRFFWVAVCCAATGVAANISGTITATRTIMENSKLVDDVTCTVTGAPCIAFGASGLTLDLNGFSITGLADRQTTCFSGPTTFSPTAPRRMALISMANRTARFAALALFNCFGVRVSFR